MKTLYMMLLVALFVGSANAQELDVDALKAQYEQHQLELDKLKTTMQMTDSELEVIEDKIKTSDYKISTTMEKIADLCEQIREVTGKAAVNTACK